ncbi:DUF6602 domain-containing protein [Phenylobacterium sp.]|uniref:DUF6602 domain-containing protein n=1 Tax=Phenylobacterium sp. TaxID=1871053 RepID=UPI0035AD7C06
MSGLSLADLLGHLHERVRGRLDEARQALAHPVAKGDASEKVWTDLFNTFLPMRYRAARAHVIDSKGQSSLQIDVAVYDRQYTPLIFELQGELVIPAESIYGVFEAKQEINAANIKAAHEKAASVRRLHQTSAPISSMGKELPGRPPFQPLAGILALGSAWKPPLGDALMEHLAAADADHHLDLGCVAGHGYFTLDGGKHTCVDHDKATTGFLFELIARLQALGTVPAIDVRAYAAWLK